MTVDLWGAPVTADDSASVDAWNSAWEQAMHFVGDPFETLANANNDDTAFVLGSVFCGTYRILGGAQPDDAAVLGDLERATSRAMTASDQAHVDALGHMVDGNFTNAARTWDDIASTQRDFAAIRFAHDAYLHVGDESRRLSSSQRAFDSWSREEPGWGFIAGQLSFALEEAGLYDEAEVLAREALDLDPLDLWSRHSLAHLYETTNDNEASFALLRDEQHVWTAQDGLAVHIWWHLALRLIATGAYGEALAVHDDQLPVATTPFRLCDLASLLWRLELVGVDVGDRWDELADRFGSRSEWHTSGFLDTHGALIYSRRPNHAAAQRFFSGARTSHLSGSSENDMTFSEVVHPLVDAIRQSPTSPAYAAGVLDELRGQLHRIGGSIAQRELLDLTQTHFEHLSASSDLSPSASEAT